MYLMMWDGTEPASFAVSLCSYSQSETFFSSLHIVHIFPLWGVLYRSFIGPLQALYRCHHGDRGASCVLPALPQMSNLKVVLWQVLACVIGDRTLISSLITAICLLHTMNNLCNRSKIAKLSTGCKECDRISEAVRWLPEAVKISRHAPGIDLGGIVSGSFARRVHITMDFHEAACSSISASKARMQSRK